MDKRIVMDSASLCPKVSFVALGVCVCGGNIQSLSPLSVFVSDPCHSVDTNGV